MGQIVSTTARGVGALIKGAFSYVPTIFKYFNTVVEHPVTTFIIAIAQILAASSRPAPLTKYATLDESGTKIDDEKKRLDRENPGLANEYAKLKETALRAGNTYNC